MASMARLRVLTPVMTSQVNDKKGRGNNDTSIRRSSMMSNILRATIRRRLTLVEGKDELVEPTHVTWWPKIVVFGGWRTSPRGEERQVWQPETIHS